MRARANAVSAAALYSTDRCIQRTALSRSWEGGSWARAGAAEPSATARVNASHRRALLMPGGMGNESLIAAIMGSPLYGEPCARAAAAVRERRGSRPGP